MAEEFNLKDEEDIPQKKQACKEKWSTLGLSKNVQIRRVTSEG